MRKVVLFLGCIMFMFSCDCNTEEEQSITGVYSLRSAQPSSCLDVSWDLYDDFFECTDLSDELRNSSFIFSGSLTINNDGSYIRNIVITLDAFIDVDFESTREGFISEFSDDNEWDTTCCTYGDTFNDCDEIRLSFNEGNLYWSILDLSDCDLDIEWEKQD